MTIRLRIGTGAVAVLAIAAGSEAVGQVQAAQAPAASSNSPASSTEEIVVTARQREERLIDVPVAATALNKAALDRYSTKDLQGIARQVPGLTIASTSAGNGAVITSRGLTSTASDAAIESEVSINIDGVSTSRGRVALASFFDLNSVEALKGPQALYFGKNSPAGVIILNSTNPAHEIEGYARVGYSFEEEIPYLEAAASLPLSDTFRSRLAIRYSDMEGGYTKGVGLPVTNPAQLPAYLAATGVTLPGRQTDLPGSKDLAGRLTLVWEPSDLLDVTLKALGSNHHDDGPSSSYRISSCNPTIGHPAVVDIGAAFGGRPAGSILVDTQGTCSIKDETNTFGALPPVVAAAVPSSHGGEPFTSAQNYVASLTVNYHLTDHITLSSITGYYQLAEHQFSSFDGSVFTAVAGSIYEKQRSWSEELRVATAYAGPLNFNGGLYFSDDNRKFGQDGLLGYTPPDPVTGRRSTYQFADIFTGRTYSAYGELNWKIAPNLELAGGVRYTKERKTGDIGNIYVNSLLSAITTPVGARFGGSFGDDNVSPQATLSWKPAHGILLYGAYKEGYKSGGYSAPALISPTTTDTNLRFGAETIAGYEGGFKFSHLLPGLSGDLTVYRYKERGLQLTVLTTEGATTIVTTQNAGSAITKGIELNLNYRPIDILTLRGSVSYDDARFGSFPNAQCWTGQPTSSNGVTPTNPADPFLPYSRGTFCVNGMQNLTNKQLFLAPKWNILGGVTLSRPLSNHWVLTLNADARYVSSYDFTPNLNPLAQQKAYVTVDLGGTIKNEVWEASLIVRNVGNRAYAVNGGEASLAVPGTIFALPGPTREISLQLTRRF